MSKAGVGHQFTDSLPHLNKSDQDQRDIIIHQRPAPASSQQHGRDGDGGLHLSLQHGQPQQRGRGEAAVPAAARAAAERQVVPPRDHHGGHLIHQDFGQKAALLTASSYYIPTFNVSIPHHYHKYYQI